MRPSPGISKLFQGKGYASSASKRGAEFLSGAASGGDAACSGSGAGCRQMAHCPVVRLLAASVAGAGRRSIWYSHRALASDQDRLLWGLSPTAPELRPGPDALFRGRTEPAGVAVSELDTGPEIQSCGRGPGHSFVEGRTKACVSLNGQELLKGRIAAKAQGYEVLLTAWSVPTADWLTVQKADATSQTTILSAVDVAPTNEAQPWGTRGFTATVQCSFGAGYDGVAGRPQGIHPR